MLGQQALDVGFRQAALRGDHHNRTTVRSRAELRLALGDLSQTPRRASRRSGAGRDHGRCAGGDGIERVISPLLERAAGLGDVQVNMRPRARHTYVAEDGGRGRRDAAGGGDPDQSIGAGRAV